jgi:hypothetical protein
MDVPARRHSMAELAFELEAAARREGRSDCAMAAWARANADATPSAFLDWLTAEPERGADGCVALLRVCGRYNDRVATAQLQRLFAERLAALPWSATRPRLEALFDRRAGAVEQGLDDAALKTLLKIVADHHPSPKGFLGQPHVLGWLPKWVDLTHYRSDGHPHLRALPMQGRGVNPD